VEGFRKTRTTFPENTYDFFQKHVRVFAERLSCFLNTDYQILIRIFSRKLIVRNFTWDSCIPACRNGWV